VKLGADFNANDPEYVDNNLVKLQVYFKDTVYKDYMESPSYSVSLIPEKINSSRYCNAIAHFIYDRYHGYRHIYLCTVIIITVNEQHPNNTIPACRILQTTECLVN